MTELLNRHRILLALGSSGRWAPESTTAQERQIMGVQIRRYRHRILLWCATAVDGVTPKFTMTKRHRDPYGPADWLGYRLDQTLSQVGDGVPSMGELATPHPNQLVETWRQAAKACVLAERDLDALDYGRLSIAEKSCRTQGRSRLHTRTDRLGPPLLQRPRVAVPQEGSAQHRRRTGGRLRGCRRPRPLRGWRRTPATITGPPPPGVAGAVQAQHNLLVDLSFRLPTALNMRRIFGTQVQATAKAMRLAKQCAPELSGTLGRRAETYRLLGRESRNIGGLIGAGGPAAAESSNAHDRLRDVSVADPSSLRELARLFESTDARIASLIELGFGDCLYLVSVKPSLVAPVVDRSAARQRQGWVPVISSVQSELLPIVRERLRPPVPPATAMRDSAAGRREYDLTLNQQPGARPTARRGY
ncbi:conserved hypothetical protein [metagenome]|uniref:Uncharacterized protein n=1 Tax=metagenome TaxID=256318 RepID=A0A2P2C8Q0_9ZZZZ